MLARRSKRGLLLVNLGTPDAPETGPVRRYLREFLSDPRVLDLPALGRWALLNLIILPFRPAKSAAAYRKIWTERGSPLLFHSQDLREQVAKRLEGELVVELAMRYGNPSIRDALARFKAHAIDELIVLPLYPQYAASSTGSSLEKIYELLGKSWNVTPIRVVPPFYDRPEFIDAFAAAARPIIERERADHVLLSFHGLPERHLRKSDERPGHCFSSGGECCNVIAEANRNCYRAQCFHTGRWIAKRLTLPADHFTISFQSRLGTTPWVKPYTDLVLPELARKGVKRLVVMCPAFVADCLETLEEIGIRAKESFLAAGGESLTLVPSLNADPAWVDCVVSMVRDLNPATSAA